MKAATARVLIALIFATAFTVAVIVRGWPSLPMVIFGNIIGGVG